MPGKSSDFEAMSLFTRFGERKYLSRSECQRFYDALGVIEDDAERTFCEAVYWTGCRPTEARELTALNIDLEESIIVIRSLKKRGKLKGRHFRAVPAPREFVERLDTIHGIRQAQLSHEGNGLPPIWSFGRTKAWRLVRSVMDAAGIVGAKSCARGLRHAFGVEALVSEVPETRLQSWLGHSSLRTTAIYASASGPEDHTIASRMWRKRGCEGYAALAA